MERKKSLPTRRDFRKVEIFSKTEKSEKPKIHLNFKPLKNIFVIVVVLAAAYYVLFSPIFKIKDVEVEGIRSVDIIDKIKISLTGKHILFINIGNFLSDLTREFPVLEEVRVVRGLPNSIKVIGSERESALIWCSSECYKMDPSGYIYEKIDKPVDKIYIQQKDATEISLGQKVATTKFVMFYVSCVDGLAKQGISVKSAEVSDMIYQLGFVTSDGWRAIFDTSESLDNQLYALKQVLEKNRSDVKEYVNLGVKGQAYIK
mgnify:CR=1 FL=1